MMSSRFARSLTKSVLGFVFLFLLTAVHAVDNPDRPDYLKEFQQRISAAEEVFAQGASGTSEQAKAGNSLVNLLEDEMGAALRQLRAGMTKEQFEGFEAAQTQWRLHFEKESDWINDYYSKQRVGSSYVLARAANKAMLLKNRVEQLLQYLKSMP